MTTKQRAYLRSMANTLKPIIHIGKDGIGEALVKQAYDALEANELVKATVLNNSPYLNAREAADELCEAVHADCVQVIGNKFTLYKESRDHKKIDLASVK